MATEDLTGAGKFIDDLVATNPVATDSVSDGDEHIRGVKNVLKNTFPNVTAAITATAADLNKTSSTFTGADGSSAGASGLVTAPAATDNTKFLKGDGTWATPSGGGSSTLAGLSDCTVSSVNPGTDTNPGGGLGHIWVNTATGFIWVCTDATTDLNEWENVGGGSGTIYLDAWFGSRGVVAGGYSSGSAQINNIDYFIINNPSNASDFGDMTETRAQTGAASDGSRGVFAGGASKNKIDYVTISTPGNATNFGTLSVSMSTTGFSNGSRGVFAGGSYNRTVWVTIASTSNSYGVHTLTQQRSWSGGCNDQTRGVVAGGYYYSVGSINIIDYFTTASMSNGTDFGDLSVSRSGIGGTSDTTRGVFVGGYYNTIDYITIATTGNATDFGDTPSSSNNGKAACGDGVYGVFMGGSSNWTDMSRLTIQTTGNSTDFGNLYYGRRMGCGCSGT